MSLTKTPLASPQGKIPRRRSARPVALAVVAFLVLGAVAIGVWQSSVFTSSTPTTPPRSLPLSGPAPITTFTAYVGAGNAVGLKALSTAVGHPMAYASDSFDRRSWSEIDDDRWAIDRWKGSGYHMIWAVQMLPATPGVSLATGATGAYDGYFRTLARNLVASGMGDSVLRLGWEFNQSKFPWYAAGQAASFVAYWRQIVTTMRSVPGAHFTYVWNPSRGDNGPKDRAMGNLADYYPGDQYVDVIGMDVYDTSWDSYPGAAREFRTMLTQRWGLDWIAEICRRRTARRWPSPRWDSGRVPRRRAVDRSSRVVRSAEVTTPPSSPTCSTGSFTTTSPISRTGTTGRRPSRTVETRPPPRRSGTASRFLPHTTSPAG